MSEVDHNQPPEKVIFAGELIWVGTFRCPTWYPQFEDTGPIRGHLMVFPHTSVCITHAGGEPIVYIVNL